MTSCHCINFAQDIGQIAFVLPRLGTYTGIKGAYTGPWTLDIISKRRNDQRINTRNPDVLNLTRMGIFH
jgi:hypothetical protein